MSNDKLTQKTLICIVDRLEVLVKSFKEHAPKQGMGRTIDSNYFDGFIEHSKGTLSMVRLLVDEDEDVSDDSKSVN